MLSAAVLLERPTQLCAMFRRAPPGKGFCVLCHMSAMFEMTAVFTSIPEMHTCMQAPGVHLLSHFNISLCRVRSVAGIPVRQKL